MGRDAKGIATGALIGAAVGFVAGILLAPKSGKETRADIARSAAAAKAKAEDKLHAAHEELASLVEKAEEQAKRLGRKISAEAKKSLETARKTKEHTASALRAIRTGESTDEDLDIAVKNARSAVQGLKTYFKK